MDHKAHHYAPHGSTLAQHLVESTGPPHTLHMAPVHSPRTDMPMAHQYPHPGHHIPPVHMGYEPQYAPYYGDPSGAGSQQQRRKAVRAAQACDNCRSKKAKCDEARPQCGNCVNNGFDCHYRSLPPPKQDRSLLQITERLEDLDHNRRVDLDGAVDRIIAEIRRAGISSHVPTRSLSLSMQHDSGSGTDGTPSIHPRTMQGQYGRIERYQSPDHHYRSSEQRDFKHDLVSPAFPMDEPANQIPPPQPKQEYSSLEKDAHADMLKGELAIPQTHSTAADKLSSWPSIEPFFEGIPARYVRNGESKHHIDLSSYARNSQPGERAVGRASTSSPSVIETPNDDASSTSGSSDNQPAAAFVNYGGVEGSRGVLPSPGGRNSNQSLSIDSEEAWRLCDAYFDHMHIIQPFLDRKEASQMVQNFIDAYCSEPVTESYRYAHVRASFASGMHKKRKYSGDHEPESAGNAQRLHGVKKPIQRTVENALIMLIFALGRVCLHQGPLPKPAASDAVTTADSTLPRGASTPMARTPGYSFDSSDSRSPRPTGDHPSTSECLRWPLNIDRFPGAAYFSHAVSILGEVHGGNTLLHVQASLLAGLYLGQLVYVYDSWKWIHTASVAWLMLFKDHDEVLKKLSGPEILAYWSCHILESDILAELELVHSGISKLQDSVPGPGAGMVGEEANIREYYMSQIHLRKILNRTHSSLYNEKKLEGGKSYWSSLQANDLNEQLENWRKTLPVRFMWSDDDLPSTDINAARLRAKYYGAKNIIFRPCLKKVIDLMSSTDAEQAMLTDPDRHSRHTQMFRDALECIKAVQHSTVGFDKVPGMKQRLIVTNIFGTAAAQFGNMLVLGAASLSEAMKLNVHPKDTLRFVQRTIEFISYLAPLSPTMRTNVQILEQIKAKMHEAIRKESSTPRSTQTSFHHGA